MKIPAHETVEWRELWRNLGTKIKHLEMQLTADQKALSELHKECDELVSHNAELREQLEIAKQTFGKIAFAVTALGEVIKECDEVFKEDE